MAHPVDQSFAFTNTDHVTQSAFMNTHHDYRLPALQPPSLDSSIQHSQIPEYPNSAVSHSYPPFSVDFNPPFTGSPHSSVATLMDTTPSVGFPTCRAISDATSMPNPMSGVGQQRAGIGSISATSQAQRNGSVGVSKVWTPPNSSDQLIQSRMVNQDDSQTSAFERQSVKVDDEKTTKKPAPWRDLKTKAGKERKRLPLACVACRRKKIRCSGEKPACKHCLRSRIPCVYKVTTRKAAPRTDYMAMLDKRLKRMEERVIKIIPKEDLPDISAATRANVKPAIPGQSPLVDGSPITKKRTADDAFAVELDGWTTANPHGDLADRANRSKAPKEGEFKLHTHGNESLPSADLQEHLAEVFFDCVYGQSYLLLHKPSFMRKLKAGTIPPVLTLAVCAVAARFSTHPAVSSEPAFLRGASWADAARAIVEKRHFEPNITILTVMVILALHYFGTCEGGLSWSFCGQALRMAYALQLHRELDHDPLGRRNSDASELSFTDREIRRRTMWACFLMDRFTASGTERPPFGDEDYLQIQLPIKESHFQNEIPGPTENLTGGVPNLITPDLGQVSDPKENMGVGAYVIRAVVMWGRIVKYLNLGGKEKDPFPIWDPKSQFANLRQQIAEFKDDLPDFLNYNAENLENHAVERIANQFLYLHIIYHQNILFLNRFAIPSTPGARPPKEMPKQFLNDAGRDALNAANQISKLIEHATGYSLTVPFAGYCAYVASTVQVWGIFSKDARLEASAKENLRHNYKYLNKIKKYWGMFHSLANTIKDSYRRFADAANRESESTENNQPALMFQYGDWFDRYPHGVSSTDFDDQEVGIKQESGSEAVMSQQSDLQSVEEFVASLSPPSKAEHPRNVARKHTKSVSEHRKREEHAHNSHGNLSQFQQSSHAKMSPLPPDQSLGQQMVNMSQMYSQAPIDPQVNFDLQSSNYSSVSGVSLIDRQMVYGAYAGMDPGNASASGNFNIWDGMDLHGFASNGIYDEPSTAYFMPFNLDPPDMENFDNGLTLGDFNVGNSFSGPSGPNHGVDEMGLDGHQQGKS